MGLEKRKIAEGIGLTCLSTGKFKTNFLSVNFISPLDKETAAANALIPSVLLRGCEKYPTMADINKKLDYLYDAGLSSRNQKRGEAQVFGICAGVLDNCYALEGEDLLSEIVGIVGDILLNPVTDGAAFDAAYTESEKNNLIDAINANINNKAYYAKKRCTEEMCRGERYGLSENGTIGDVQAITPESLYARYRYALKHYPIEIFFVGQTDEDRLAEKLRAVFTGLERDIISVPAPEIVRAVSDVKRIDEDMPVNQGKLVIGMRSGVTLHDPDYPAMLMFNEIFGGGVTSKLFMNVREKMSLCYYCSSSPDSYKGLLFVQSGIEVENREVAETAINDQLEAVRRGEFTEEEMRSAYLGLVNSYRELSDSARGLESWYLGRMLAGVGGAPDDVSERLSVVTKDEIIAAAKKSAVDTVYFLRGTLKGDGSEGDEEDA